MRLTEYGPSGLRFALQISLQIAAWALAAFVLNLGYERWPTVSRGPTPQYRMLASIPCGANATSVAISSDGRLIALANLDGYVRLFRCGARGELPSPPRQKGRPFIALSPDGRMIAIAGESPRVLIWSIERGEVAREIDTGVVESPRLEFSPDGTLLAAVDGPRGLVELWDSRTGLLDGRIRGPGEGINDCEFSPDGRSLALASRQGSVTLHEVAGGLELWRVPGPPANVMALAFSPDGTRLASSNFRDRFVRFWTVDGGRPDGTIGGDLDRVQALALSSKDGTIFVSTPASDSLMSIHPGSRQPLTKQSIDGAACRVMSLARNGDRLVTGHDDGTVRIWDTSRIVEAPGRARFRAEDSPEEARGRADI